MATLSSFHRRSILLLALCVFMWSGTVAAQGDVIDAAASAAAAPLVLDKVWAAPSGTEAVFYIDMVSIQEVVDRTGLFQAVPAHELEEFSELAVVAHYTMLPSPDTAASGGPQVLVRALPVDIESGRTVPGTRWEVTYLLTPNGVVYVSGDVVVGPYGALVEPDWLVDWSVMADADLPTGEVHVGDEWWGASKLDFVGADVPFSETDLSAMGAFLGWTDDVGAPGAAALIAEYFDGTATGRDELFEGIDAILSAIIEGAQLLLVVPGTFPEGAHHLLVGNITMSVGPESGAPEGLEGSVELALEFERNIEQLGLDDFPWAAFEDSVGGDFSADEEIIGDEEITADVEEFDVSLSEFEELYPGVPTTGILGAWSEELGDGTYADYYTFFGLEGETIVVDLISRDFDAFLMLLDDEWYNIAFDDDSGGGTDARLTFKLPYTGTYIVVANAYFEGESGMYTLMVDVWEPGDIDFDRAVNLIGLLSIDYPLSDAELAEAETLLIQLLELVQSMR